MAGELPYNTENFCDKAATVLFGTEKMGGTDGAISISREDETKEVKCNQSQGVVIEERITKITMTVKAKFKEITPALKVLIGDELKITGANIGINVLNHNKADLVLGEIGGTRIHTIKGATADLAWSYDVDGENDHGIEITWKASLNINSLDSEELYAVTETAPSA